MPTTTAVHVERSIKQVRDDRAYKGTFKIGGADFEWEVLFNVPITKLDETPINGTAETRRAIEIRVKRKDGHAIELTDDEYGFFFRLVAVLAIEFFNLSQTRRNNEGVLGAALRGSPPPFIEGFEIGMTSNIDADFSPDLCEMLAQPKFGCRF